MADCGDGISSLRFLYFFIYDFKGDLNLSSESHAREVQGKLEKSLGSSLSFKLQSGDLVINKFEKRDWLSGPKLRRRNTGYVRYNFNFFCSVKNS